ncbi:universal stress protein [Flavobacteriaceae bacterium F89]|uniref:Universal stress protein n=1 Tax=Cerina litoralis TaxID=2874477 RepID=A0AAE3EX49_9FLAO|nr:universal stress protein [Cerina litoralis]MCG2462732.1 universal stress protein [Cerina litoralis]
MTDKHKPILDILVPTDFTNNAFHALCYTTQLLKDRECNIYLLHVYNQRKGFKTQSINNTIGTSSDELRQESEVRLEQMHHRVQKKKNNPKHTYKLIVEPDNLIGVIHSLVDVLGIDLVVLGNKGKKSSIPVFLGDIATKTMESVSKCPVITVPKSARITIPREIAFATDFKKPYNPKALNSIRSMALRCGATLRIVHIQEKEGLNSLQRTNLDWILAHFEPVPYSLVKMPNFISKAKVLQVFLEDTNIKMLAMINNEYTILEKMLREPIIEKMLLKIDIPFFIIPDTTKVSEEF